MLTREVLAHLIQAAIRRAKFPHPTAAARAMGTDPRSLQRILAGATDPKVSTLVRLFDRIGWDVSITFQPRRSTGKTTTKKIDNTNEVN